MNKLFLYEKNCELFAIIVKGVEIANSFGLIREGVIITNDSFKIKSWNPGYGFDVLIKFTNYNDSIVIKVNFIKMGDFYPEEDLEEPEIEKTLDLGSIRINDWEDDSSKVEEALEKLFKNSPSELPYWKSEMGTTPNLNIDWCDDVLNIV